MPNRYIKESCVSSPTLSALTDAAERFFWRLTTVADDYGRFDANPAVLLGRCVPTLEWTQRKVALCLAELCHLVDGDEFPLVEVYRVKGRLYGRLTNWSNHQRDRTKDQNPPKPKFPGPEQGLTLPPQAAANCGNLRELAALNESESDNEYEYEERTTPRLAASEFDVVWNSYPRKVGKKAAKKAWEKLNGSRPVVVVILAAIDKQRHWPQWTKDKGEFIPHLATWLNNARWDDEEPTPSPTALAVTLPKAFRKLDTVRSDHQPMPEDVRQLMAQAGKGKGMPG